MDCLCKAKKKNVLYGDRVLRGSLIRVALQKHDIVGDNAGRLPCFALLIGDLAVAEFAGDQGALTLAQVRHDGIAKRGLEDDDAMPVGALRPVAVLVSTRRTWAKRGWFRCLH